MPSFHDNGSAGDGRPVIDTDGVEVGIGGHDDLETAAEVPICDSSRTEVVGQLVVPAMVSWRGTSTPGRST